jgi:hypothetical protein
MEGIEIASRKRLLKAKKRILKEEKLILLQSV